MDIVERLRKIDRDDTALCPLAHKAADEIARLRADYQETIEKLQAVCEEHGCEPGLNRFDFLRSEFARLRARVERLTAALQEIAGWILPTGMDAQDAARAALADDRKEWE